MQKNIDYNTFLEKVKDSILEYLPDEYRNGIVKVSKCPKNNITLDGLSVLIPTETGTNVVPVMK